MTTTSTEALWFLPFVAPLALWAAWTDLNDMKIRNVTVMAIVAVFLVVGLVALPFPEYAWRLLHFAVVLIIGFLLHMAGVLGGGDAKLMAAIAPFVAVNDIAGVLFLFAFLLLLSFGLHRLLRRVSIVRRATPNWQSWDHAAFPMGLALGTLLIVYLAQKVFWGV